MLKKTITYDNYDDESVTEDFYFNFTKLEAVELELEFGGIEETIKRISESSDAKEAYQLFKQILIAAVGRKSEDGKRFIKNPDITSEFADSPALGELVFELLQNPTYAATFVEQILPKKMVEAAKADEETNKKLQEQMAALNAAKGVDAPPLVPEPPAAVAPQDEPRLKDVSEYSPQELLALSDEDFDKVAGTDPQKMSQRVLMVAFQRKNRA